MGWQPLAALAAELNDPSSSFSAADESGRNGGGGASATTAIAQALSPVRAHWSASYEAAKKAGAALAAQLRARRCGERPVTLIGVFGARVVWHCLEVLADLPDTDGTGLVFDVLLIAAPVTANPDVGRRSRPSSPVADQRIRARRHAARCALPHRPSHGKGCCGHLRCPRRTSRISMSPIRERGTGFALVHVSLRRSVCARARRHRSPALWRE